MENNSDFLNYKKIDEFNQFKHPTKPGTLYEVIFEAFKNEFESKTDDISQIKNCKELRNAIHSFKNSCTNIGAIQLTIFCQGIEDCCEGKIEHEDCSGCMNIEELKLLGEKSMKKIEEYIYG